jgi:AcrR family transcriptional regulator
VARQRLSRDERHVQLLETAAAIVRSEGADGLTLGRVAEEAGVSKPIVYDHFETRVGLLKGLYQRIDEQQAEAARAALDSQARDLEGAAAILAEAYVDCVLHIGREFGAITAALSASAELEEVLSDGRQRYAESFLAALERFASPPEDQAMPVMLGVIGAAEALAREASAGRLSRLEAVTALKRIIVGAARGE